MKFFEKFLANNFALSNTEENTSGPLNRGGIVDLSLLRTLLAIQQMSWEPSFLEMINSFVSLAYVSFAASRTLLQHLLACLNFTLDSDLFFSCKRKKWFLWIIAAAQAAENHGDECGLTWYLRWGIYTSIPTWTYSEIY